MKESRKLLIGVVVAVAIIIGLAAFTWNDKEVKGREEDYKLFLQNLGSSVRISRLGGDPSSSLKSAQNNYSNLVEGENFENDSPLSDLDGDIKNSFNTFISKKENAETSKVKSLRKDGASMGERLGVSLRVTYQFSSLIIIILAVLLTFISTVACKMLIDWEKLKEKKEFIEEWEQKILEAKRKKGKKRRKLETKDKEIRSAKERVWGTSIKQAVFYLAPLILLLAFFKLLYSDWIIAWVPFDWFASGMLRQFLGVSFRYLGWSLLAFFGFAQIWREFLLSEEK